MPWFPDDKRPVFWGTTVRRDEVGQINRYFDIKLEGMTKKQLADFAKKVFAGNKSEMEGRRILGYLYEFMLQNKIDEETMFGILSGVVDTEIKRLENMKGTFEEPVLQSYANLRTSYSYLVKLKDPSTTEKLLSVVTHIMKKGYYKDKASDLLADAMQYLHESVRKDLFYSSNIDPGMLTTLINNLYNLQKELRDYPYHYNLDAQENLTNIMRIVENNSVLSNN